MTQDVRVKLSAEGVAQVVQAFQTVQKAGTDATAAVNARAESDEQAAARLRDVVKASLDAQAATEEMAASTRSATAAGQASAKADQDGVAKNKAYTAAYRDRVNAQKAEVDSLRGVTAEVKSGASSLADLAAQEKKAAAAFDKGAISLEEYQQLLVKLDAQHAKLSTTASKTPAAVGSTTSALSGSAAADVQRIVRELATGQYQSAISSTSVLAQQVGLLEAAFSPLGAAVIAGAGALTVFGLAAGDAYDQQQKLNSAIAISGNYAGVTQGSFDKLAGGIARTNGQFSDTRDILVGLVASGKVGSDALEAVGQAGLDIAVLTKKGAEEATQSALQMFDGTTAGLLKANEQYHFLSAATLDQVRALEEEGRTQDVVRVGAEAFHDAIAPRIQTMTDQVYGLAKAWKGVSDEFLGWENTFKKGAAVIAGTADDQTRVYELLGRKASSNDGSFAAIADGLTGRAFDDDDQKELDRLQAKIVKDQADAAASSVANQVKDDGAQAAVSIDKLTSSLDKAKERQDALNKAANDLYKISLAGGKLPEGINFNGPAADVPQGPGWEKLQAEINKRYADPKAPKVKDTSNELAASQKQLQDQLLTLTGSLDGPVSAAWDKYAKAMLDASAAGGKAIKAGADPAVIQDQVSKIQEAAAAARDKAISDVNRGLQVSYLQATGQTAEASKIQIEAQYDSLLKDLQKRGDTAGVDLVHSLINVSEASSQLQEMQQQIQTVLQDQSRQEQGIQAEQQSGLKTEYDARESILELHQRTAAQLEQMLPLYKQLAESTGSPQALEQYQNLSAELDRLKLQTNDLKLAFDSGITNGLEQGLVGLATQTETVGQAFKQLGQSILQSLAQVAAQKIASDAISALDSLGGGSGTQDVGQGATKLAAAGAVVGVSAGLMASSAASLQSAADTLLIANSLSAVGGFAEGGFTGPGGKFEPAGVVHRGEYVQPAIRLAEPGALAFMRDFHSSGMAAIADWAPGYAQGGLVGPPPPSAPRRPATPDLQPSGGGGKAPSVALRNINVVDPALVRDFMESSDGETVIMNTLSRNESKVRQITGPR